MIISKFPYFMPINKDDRLLQRTKIKNLIKLYRCEKRIERLIKILCNRNIRNIFLFRHCKPTVENEIF